MNDYFRFWQVEQSIFLREIPSGEMFYTHSLSQGIPRLLHFSKENFPSVILIIGGAGSGKTSVLKWLLSTISADSHDVWYVPVLSQESQKGWLISRLARYLGVVDKSLVAPQELLTRAGGKLEQLIEEKRRLLVLVDDAQWVGTEDALSDFSAFLNLQSLGARCLSFVIAADRTFEEKLSNHPILSKVVMRLEMNPLDHGETQAYLDYRCKLAGCPNMFSFEAAEIIYQKTQGVPGLVNILAENCLFEAFQNDRRDIDGLLVQRAFSHVSFLATEESGGSVSHFVNHSSFLPESTGEGGERSSFPVPKPTEKLQESLALGVPGVPGAPGDSGSNKMRQNLRKPPPQPPPSSAEGSSQGYKPEKNAAALEKTSDESKQDQPILLTSLFKSDPKPGKT